MLRLATKGKVGFSARLGVKRVGGAGRLAYKHSEGIEKGAGIVESVAGKLGAAAGTGATVAALSGAGVPVATGLAAVGGGLTALSKGAGMVKTGAAGVSRVKEANRRIDQFLG